MFNSFLRCASCSSMCVDSAIVSQSYCFKTVAVFRLFFGLLLICSGGCATMQSPSAHSDMQLSSSQQVVDANPSESEPLAPIVSAQSPATPPTKPTQAALPEPREATPVLPVPAKPPSSRRGASRPTDQNRGGLGQNGQLLQLPAAGKDEDIQYSSDNNLVTLNAKDASLGSVLSMIAQQHGLNVVSSTAMTERISVTITQAPLEDTLNAILAANGYCWAKKNDIVIVSSMNEEQRASPTVQGREVLVFDLNYVAAADIDKVVHGLLSPVGQSFVTQTMPTDRMRTQEQLVVEDLPEYLERITQYIHQVDHAPRQVQIEAHVLQILLKDNSRHGVNFQNILRIAHSDVTVSTVGLASANAPASMIRLEGSDLDGLLEALRTTTDAKTLASPKVTVLNNQEARIQVGGKIGYLLSTTTQTSTLQSVNFLDVGVIMTVVPTITEDGQVMMKVAPQVSTGRINPTTQLPESETTEVTTQVLLSDGEAIVIGGLIKENDSDGRNRIPILGDIPGLGWLFQRRETLHERNEIVITLVPRIVPNCHDYSSSSMRTIVRP